MAGIGCGALRPRRFGPNIEASRPCRPGPVRTRVIHSIDLVEWAEVVIVMEKVHRKRLNKTLKSGLRNKKFVVLGIADRYGYMDPALV